MKFYYDDCVSTNLRGRMCDWRYVDKIKSWL